MSVVLSMAMVAGAEGDNYKIDVQQITTSGMAFGPGIYENKIVYVNGQSENYPQGIYVHDISTGKDYKITDDVIAAGEPAIYDDIVVWAHTVNSYQGYYDIYMRHISGGDIIQVTTDGRSVCPDIYGEKIAYNNGTHPWVYVYDIATGEKNELVDYGAIPSISGNKVAYQSNYNAYICDLSDPQPLQLSNDGHTDYVKIDGDKVVLEKSTTPAIVMCDISSGQIIPIADAGQQADINGNRIVWVNGGNVYMYNVSDGQTVQVTANGYASQPAIYGDRIVWTDGHAGPGIVDIYMATVTVTPQPTPTKKVAVVLTTFSDSGEITDEDMEMVKHRCDLIQQYYVGQSYGKQFIDFDFCTAEVGETEAEGKKKLDISIPDNTANNAAMWEKACIAAGLEMTDSDPNDYDVAMVIYPTQFRSYSWPDSPSSVCSAVGIFCGYGNWAQELGHSLYGLHDKGGNEPKEGNVGLWSVMSIGYQLNPPAPIIGFEKNKLGWLLYSDISAKDISNEEKIYPVTYLDDSSLQADKLLRLNTKAGSNVEYYIFEARRAKDGVATDPLKTSFYPLFIKQDRGIMVYEVTNDGSGDKIYAMPRSLGLQPSLGVGESIKLERNTIKANCYESGEKLQVGFESFEPLSSKIWSMASKIEIPSMASPFGASEEKNIDVDLNLVGEGGKRVGVDYADNAYRSEIDGAEASGNVLGGGPEWISVPSDVDAEAFVTISPDLKVLLESDPAASVEVSASLEVYDENGNVQEAEPFSFTISGANLKDSYELPLAIDDPEPILPIADFTANVSEGHRPLDIQFISKSTDATALEWNFGDSSANATITDPVHTFTDAGSYVVVLTAINENGTSSKNMVINVTKSAAEPKDKNPVADFRADVRKGTAPLSVNFTDTSEHVPSQWIWDFGDGSEVSVEQNPIHVYEQAGNYTVNLTVRNEAGTDNKMINQFIRVEAGRKV